MKRKCNKKCVLVFFFITTNRNVPFFTLETRIYLYKYLQLYYLLVLYLLY